MQILHCLDLVLKPFPIFFLIIILALSRIMLQYSKLSMRSLSAIAIYEHLKVQLGCDFIDQHGLRWANFRILLNVVL